MFFRNVKPKEDIELSVTPVHVMLPVHLRLADATAAFSDPLARQMAVIGLGYVTETRARKNVDGSSDGLDLFLDMTSVADTALGDVMRILEHLGAPKGSWLRRVDGASDRTFGRAVGMEICVSTKAGAHEARIQRLSRACTQAVGKAAILQGSRTLPGQVAFYFYGLSYKDMQDGLTERLGLNPMLSDVTLRLLN